MKKITLSASIIRSVLALFDLPGKPLKLDGENEAPIILKLKEVVGNKWDGDIKIELPKDQYDHIKYMITEIGKNMLMLGMLL